MTSDSVAEFLTRVRNAVDARHKKVDVAASRLRVSIAEILKKNGFIRNYKLYRQEQKGILRIYLKYVEKDQPVIHGITRVSKPSRRVYSTYAKVPKILGGMGLSVLSTSKGVISDETARTEKVGGEIICSVW